MLISFKRIGKRETLQAERKNNLQLVVGSFDNVNCMEEVWEVLKENNLDSPIYWILDNQLMFIHAQN